MNPLAIVGRLGEPVDARLIDGQPLRRPQSGAHLIGQVLVVHVQCHRSVHLATNPG